MLRTLLFTIVGLMSTSLVFSQEKYGVFDTSADIGNSVIKGKTEFLSKGQEYKMTGSGYNIWFERDEFQYAYKKVKGDFILTAQFSFEGKGADPHRKTGWMVRESADDNAAHVSAVLHGDGLTVMQWRKLKGAFMRDPQDEIFAPKAGYDFMQLERKGNTYIMRAAHIGEPLQVIGSETFLDMPDEVLVGLFVSSHNADAAETALIKNVRIDFPVNDDYNPGREGYLGCRLETIDVFTGDRNVIFEKPGRFEAPNWMPDGKKLLFNMDGNLYTIPVEGGNPEKFNTGSANQNNNDHGISFNGKLVAISSHREGLPEGGSTVYVVPITGGEPRQITEHTPSYWHGWAPNNKELVYVAKRKPNTPYNIYKANINTLVETQITFFDYAHVDGPEYSPDGKYIYYNGSQSGTMQLWRMKPDGSNKEQLTFDQYNNWFPHISPDGKWILFISFPESIDPDSHPSYKRVELRLMPASGGFPKTVAYLYGGQGTINVPSWSPDSKKVAFVSNSGEK
ncbi:MAG: DUF5050 domain-containing protein [Cyclobacteriaceae bacterium]|nr:DUF5050 domain-containing protein [Cyclobacteriaceae bacterium]